MYGVVMSSQFEPKDAGYKEKVIESFERQEVMKTLNASVQTVRPGEVELKLPYQQNLTQQHGFIHAGIVSTVLDSACGYAAFSLMPEKAAVLTIEFKINLLSPAKGDWFRAVGKVKKSGKNITVTEGELFSHADGQEKLVATMVGTIMSVYDRDGIEN
jgi:uncharacterized protein (TIGR00369 family)